MSFFLLFVRASIRRLQSRPLASLLLLISVALATCVFVATLFASFASVRSFQDSMRTFGRSESIQIRSRMGVFDTSLIRDVIAELPPDILIIAVLEGQLYLDGTAPRQLSLSAAALAASAGSNEGDAVLPAGVGFGEIGLSRTLADELGVAERQAVRIRSAAAAQEYRARILEPESGAAALSGVLLPLAEAQRLTAMEGKLSSLILVPPEGLAVSERLSALERLLNERIASDPARSLFYLDSKARRGDTATALLAAFRGNIYVLVLITCAVCAFAILNAAHLSTVSMREEFRVLRTLGVSRTQIVWLVLAEYLTLGVIGAAIGLSAGQPLSSFLVGLLADTVRDLYLGGNTFPEFGKWDALRFYLAGMVAGPACSVLGALVPALRSGRVRGGFTSNGREAAGTLHWMLALLLALLLLGGSLLLGRAALNEGSIRLAHGAALLLAAAVIACAIPATAAIASRRIAPLYDNFSLEGMVARANVAASVGSHAFMLAVSGLALSVLVALGVMVSSFRQALGDWAAYTFQADVFVRMAERGDAQQPFLIPGPLIETLRAIPSVEEISRYTAVSVEQNGQMLQLAAADLEIGLRRGVYRLLAGQAAPLAISDSDCVLLNESAGRKLGMSVGEEIRIAGGRHRVCGLYRDFSTERPTVLMDYSRFTTHYGAREPINAAIYARAGVHPVELREHIRAAAQGMPLLATLNADLRRLVEVTFDQTFRITTVLQVIVALMSGFGFVVSLLQLLRERSRDFKTLHTLGVSWRSLRLSVFLEGLALTIPALVLGCCGGTLLALVLIEVINPVSFGWSFEPRFEAGRYAQAALIVFAANTIASLLPVWWGQNSVRSARLSEE